MGDFAIFIDTKQRAESGNVFIHFEMDGFLIWKEVSKELAMKDNMQAIMCSKCKTRPAIQMDNFYPYFDDYCLCKECTEGGE